MLQTNWNSSHFLSFTNSLIRPRYHDHIFTAWRWSYINGVPLYIKKVRTWKLNSSMRTDENWWLNKEFHANIWVRFWNVHDYEQNTDTKRSSNKNNNISFIKQSLSALYPRETLRLILIFFPSQTYLHVPFHSSISVHTAVSINVVGPKYKTTRQDRKVTWNFLWINSSKSVLPRPLVKIHDGEPFGWKKCYDIKWMSWQLLWGCL